MKVIFHCWIYESFVASMSINSILVTNSEIFSGNKFGCHPHMEFVQRMLQNCILVPFHYENDFFFTAFDATEKNGEEFQICEPNRSNHPSIFQFEQSIIHECRTLTGKCNTVAISSVVGNACNVLMNAECPFMNCHHISASLMHQRNPSSKIFFI